MANGKRERTRAARGAVAAGREKREKGGGRVLAKGRREGQRARTRKMKSLIAG